MRTVNYNFDIEELKALERRTYPKAVADVLIFLSLWNFDFTKAEIFINVPPGHDGAFGREDILAVYYSQQGREYVIGAIWNAELGHFTTHS